MWSSVVENKKVDLVVRLAKHRDLCLISDPAASLSHTSLYVICLYDRDTHVTVPTDGAYLVQLTMYQSRTPVSAFHFTYLLHEVDNNLTGVDEIWCGRSTLKVVKVV